MFLEKSPERLTRRTRIERWLLLALRCLALILLALMFGRPFLRSSSLDLDAGDGKRVVILLDESASMQREELWKRGSEEAIRAIRNLAPNDEAAFATFSQDVDIVAGFETWASLPPAARADAAAKHLDERGKAGWKATRLGAALSSGAELIEDAEADREFAAREIVVISDFQEGAELESLNRYAWPEDIAVRCVPILPEDPGNLTVNLVAASAEGGEEADPESGPAGDIRRSRRVRISNARDSKIENFSLAWNGATDTRLDSFLPAGASRVMPAPPRESELTDGVLEISGDTHAFDNRVYVSRSQPRAVRLVFLAEKVEGGDVGSPLFYLSRAMHKTPTVDPAVAGVSFSELAIQPEILKTADVLIVHGNAPGEVAKASGEFAEDGGLVLAVVSENSTADSLQSILGIGDLQLAEAEVRDYAMLADLDFDHPVLAPFARAQVRDFTKVRTWKHRSLVLPEAASENARILARFDSGEPAWVDVRRGDGRVFVFLSGWEPRESQLALSSKFVPLIYAILAQAGFSATESRPLYVGDPIPVDGSGVMQVPAGESVSIQTEKKAFTETGEPGFYALDSGTGEPRIFAVNLAPSESRIDPLDPTVALGDLGVNVHADDAGTTAALTIQEAEEAEVRKRRLEAEEKEERQKLWKWIVLLVLVTLLAETWLAGRRRNLPSTTAESAAA